MVTVLMLSMFMLLVATIFLKHPLDVSACLMLAGSLGAGVLSFTASCLMGFALFMVMVGGVLVFLAFCVALVPYSKSFSYKKSSKRFLILSGLLFWAGLGVGVFVLATTDPLSGLTSSHSAFFRGAESFVCCREWGVVMVLLGMYLLAAIIVGVAVSSKYSGALVNKNWHDKKMAVVPSMINASQEGAMMQFS
uniref:NADH dehydrogenase subunit 6 n=1 Tax=Teredo bartschi TaxID=2939325 RepID=UPI002029662B|nr:NADH dehydrogenase subunit 6 [Teredo bartschi]UPX89292.1 NADH dehydrogenase subunit 6 [Teredo bartschi]